MQKSVSSPLLVKLHSTWICVIRLPSQICSPFTHANDLGTKSDDNNLHLCFFIHEQSQIISVFHYGNCKKFKIIVWNVDNLSWDNLIAQTNVAPFHGPMVPKASPATISKCVLLLEFACSFHSTCLPIISSLLRTRCGVPTHGVA